MTMHFDSDFIEDIEVREAMGTERLQALDNLLALYSLQRQKKMYGGGVIVFHSNNPGNSLWLGSWESEDQWLEDILSLINRL